MLGGSIALVVCPPCKDLHSTNSIILFWQVSSFSIPSRNILVLLLVDKERACGREGHGSSDADDNAGNGASRETRAAAGGRGPGEKRKESINRRSVSTGEPMQSRAQDPPKAKIYGL